MSVTMSTADAALKNVYLNIVRDQINTETAPVYNKIKTSTRDIQGGRKVVKLAPFGLNGGSGAGTETGALPTSGGNNYVNFESTLKKLYGVIEISDLAIEASKSDVGAFVNLLKSEMDGILKGCKHSFGRQIYLDGTGKLTFCGITTASTTVNVVSTQYLMEGMIIDILDTNGAAVANGTQRRILSVDRVNKTITLAGTATVTTAETDFITEQGAYNNELTGFGKIFSSGDTLYGLSRSTYYWMVPQLKTNVGSLSDKKIIVAMMDAKNIAGGKIDFIACNPYVLAEYYDYLEATKRNVNTMELTGGFTAISINGVPLTDDKFIGSGEMYLLDTTQFTFHQLADWDWMQDQNGSVLKQVAGYPKWTATLRKYAEVICDHPGAQVKMSGITITA